MQKIYYPIDINFFDPEFMKKAINDLNSSILGQQVLEGKHFTSPRIMVRSTGREDSEKVTNAGGNESVSNVNPNDPGDVGEAVKQCFAHTLATNLFNSSVLKVLSPSKLIYADFTAGNDW